MAQEKQLAYLLVGDHLGQVKKVLIPSYEVSILADCASPSSSNPVVSIEPIIGNGNRQLIANKNGDLYIYDCIQGLTKPCTVKGHDSLIKALPVLKKKVLFVYDKHVILSGNEIVKQKSGEIKNAQVKNDKLAYGGLNIPLKIFDIEKRVKVFEADPPEKDWLGIQPDIYVSGIEYIGETRVATCSKSDSVIRIYDTQRNNRKPVISVDINQTAFNEHADSARFISIASTGDSDHTVVVGSNVGQILAIDLRFHVKQVPKKKLQPRNHKILGGFKGARGASIKDLKLVPGSSINTAPCDDGDSDSDEAPRQDKRVYKVISCCLDRYLRIHDFTKTSRYLYKHVYMNTKPMCCSPVYM